MKILKIIIALNILALLSTSFGLAKAVYKGDNVYTGWEHKVWVDDQTGEVTIVGNPTKEESKRATQNTIEQLRKNEEYAYECRQEYERDEERQNRIDVEKARTKSTDIKVHEER